MTVGRLLSLWEGDFSGAMLNFGKVNMIFQLMVNFEGCTVFDPALPLELTM